MNCAASDAEHRTPNAKTRTQSSKWEIVLPFLGIKLAYCRGSRKEQVLYDVLSLGVLQINPVVKGFPKSNKPCWCNQCNRLEIELTVRLSLITERFNGKRRAFWKLADYKLRVDCVFIENVINYKRTLT